MPKNLCQLILGSASPRRKELLGNTFLPFETVVSGVEEYSPEKDPAKYVSDLALQKGSDVYEKVKDSYSFPLVLGSDTVVASEGRILEKPADVEEAREILLSLSGKTHEVFTGVSLICPKFTKTFNVKTSVTFGAIASDLLELYLSTGDSLDKAGAYGIQGAALSFIDSIEGSYSNVVGLPLSHTLNEIEAMVKKCFPDQKEWRSCFESN
ncbi:MAG: septum formation protein Maf [Bacteriovoracaceae bacterium]|nr:septum formation protein Maf [Bacteriovoracaceae bacterium]